LLKVKTIIITLLAAIVLVYQGKAQDANVLFRWDFNDSLYTAGKEFKSSSPFGNYQVGGLTKYSPGVKGLAIRLDGFSSYVDVVPGDLSEGSVERKLFNLPRLISMEAWVSLGAYPWNRAPILTMGKYGITGFYFGIDSRGRPVFEVSDGTSTWHECVGRLNPETKLGMELNRWYHIVATIDSKAGLAIYVNGRLESTYNEFVNQRRIAYNETEKGFRMGMNRELTAPSDPVREWATFPSRYSLDGLLDEIAVYDRCLTAEEVMALYASVRPENEPAFVSRKFPTVKTSGRFAASYTRLKFYPEWDALWPAGYHDDVVVQFDELPFKVIFWRGTRYSPCLVSENGKWMADQSRETGNNWFLSQGSSDDYPTGCMEHMSDVQCRSSRVAIIESNEARVVVNWRYLQMDVMFRQNDLPDNTGFGEWGNELYYIYPDGVAVRKVLPGRGGWQETIFLNEPGTRPEDNVELEAVTLINMHGDRKTYSWEHGYPKFDLKDANIQIVNFKSKFKPFLILRNGGSFSVFNGEVRPEFSHFPWWNHWPVTQVSSDGRYASAPDHAAHSSLSWGDSNGEAALYGMTEKDPSELVALARSWNYPATLSVESTIIKNNGYDYTQRAYLLETGKSLKKISLKLNGSKDSPIVNPAFVIHGQPDEGFELKVNGRTVPRGKDFRYSVEYDEEGTPSLIIWIKYQSEGKVEVELHSN
jgi:hypothetical protein